MSQFEVPIKEIEIKNHPNADNLEIGLVGKFQTVVPIGKYETGDLVAFIPVDSIVPEWVLENLGLVGKLDGSNRDRVKVRCFRGVVTEGLVYPVEWNPVETENGDVGNYSIQLQDERHVFGGQYAGPKDSPRIRPTGKDVKDLLGIAKYEPTVPSHMGGEVFNARGHTVTYDVENFKKYPDALKEGEPVVITEKLHGSFCEIGVVPREQSNDDAGRFIVTSKGRASKGQALQLNDANENSIYVRAAREHGIMDKLSDIAGYFYVLGEVYGNRVQDLGYGEENNEIGFRAFDIFIGDPQTGHFVNDFVLESLLDSLDIPRVPVLYRGPFSEDILEKHTNGAETLTGQDVHIREGVVVRPQVERHQRSLGRVQLKSVSDDYLTRKGGTEYN